MSEGPNDPNFKAVFTAGGPVLVKVLLLGTVASANGFSLLIVI